MISGGGNKIFLLDGGYRNWVVQPTPTLWKDLLGHSVVLVTYNYLPTYRKI